MEEKSKHGLFFFTLMILMLLQGNTAGAQAAAIDSSYTTDYYQQRVAFFRQMPDQKNEVIFLGNSITEKGEWAELLRKKTVVNRGIGGDNTFGVLARLDEVLSSRPKKIFLLIGINDIARGSPLALISANYRRIIQQVKTASPRTKLIIQSVLPMNDSLLTYGYLKNKNAKVVEVNTELQSLATQYGITYIDLHPLFSNASGALQADMTTDGIHLKSVAYIRWVAYLKQQKLL